MEENRTESFWYKKIDEVIETKVSRHLSANPDQAGQFTVLDIVLGGNHGQGSFRLVIKVILQNRKNEILSEIEWGVGEVECGTDNSEILLKTLILHLNEATRKMIRYSRDSSGSIFDDGSLAVYNEIADPAMN